MTDWYLGFLMRVFGRDRALSAYFLTRRIVLLSAIGATVRVQTGATTRTRYVQGGTGKGGQDSQSLHFGVADATSVDSIQVVFPGGTTVDFVGPFPVDQRLWVFEDGTWQAGWAPPP